MLSMIKYLYRKSGKWVSISALSELEDISVRTTKIYLKKLEEIFIDHVEFSTKAGLIKAEFSHKVGINYLRMIISKNTVIYQILNASFFQVSNKNIDLSSKFNISDSSAYRNIQLLNDSMEGVYNLEFSFAKLSFAGEEGEIINFYKHFFLSTYRTTRKWPFEGLVDKEAADHLADKFLNYMKEDYSYSNVSYFQILIAILAIRLSQGHTMESTRDPNVVRQAREFLDQDGIIDFVKDKFPSTDQDPRYLIFELFTYISEYECFYFQGVCGNERHMTCMYPSYYNYFDDMVDRLADKFNFEITNKDELITLIAYSFNCNFFRLRQADFFTKEADYYLEYMKFVSIDLYTYLEEEMTKFKEKFPYSTKPYSVMDLVYGFYWSFPGILSEQIKNSRKCKVLILSSYDQNFAPSLAKLINKNFGDFFSADIYKDKVLDWEKIEASNYEVILTDFTVTGDIEGKLVYTVEELPMASEVYTLVSSILDHLSRIKELQYPGEFNQGLHMS